MNARRRMSAASRLALQVHVDGLAGARDRAEEHAHPSAIQALVASELVADFVADLRDALTATQHLLDEDRLMPRADLP